jgi:hypothetical protein
MQSREQRIKNRKNSEQTAQRKGRTLLRSASTTDSAVCSTIVMPAVNAASTHTHTSQNGGLPSLGGGALPYAESVATRGASSDAKSASASSSGGASECGIRGVLFEI